MKNYQQTVKQRRVALVKAKTAFANTRNVVQHISVKDKQSVLDGKQWQPMPGCFGNWF